MGAVPLVTLSRICGDEIGGTMVEISAVYEGDYHCSANHGPSGSTLSTDAPTDNQGRGEAFSPTDLCATALVTCMSTIMGMRADELGIDLKGMKIEVQKVMSSDGPRRIVELPVEFWIPGRLTDQQKSVLRHAAENCPVILSLHPEIRKPITMYWEGEV